METSYHLYEDDASFCTLLDIFDHSTRVHAERIAFRIRQGTGYREFSYREFGEQARALACYLAELGVGKKKKVGLLAENRPEWGIGYFAVLLCGAVVVPIDAQLTQAEVEHIANDSDAMVLLCSGNQFDKLSEVASLIRKLKKVILLDPVPTRPRNAITLEDAIAQGRKSGKQPNPSLQKDDLAALIYTSGTTGSSKGVMLSHWNITSNVLGLRKMVHFDQDDNFLSVLPLHHTFECTAGLMVPLSRGCAITTAEALASKRIIANIKETRVTIMLGVPLLFEKMVNGLKRAVAEKGPATRMLFATMMGLVKGLKRVTGKNYGHKVFSSLRQKAGLSTIRLMISGGAPLQPWVAHTFENLGIDFLQGYGLTETSPVLTVNITAEPRNETVGFPVPGIELALHEPNQDGVGELKARGEFVMQGYYRNPKATSAVMRDGWFHTGDLASFDARGRVIICGRSKNLIVTPGGKNVYPEELEMRLNDSDYIAEALVMGRPVSSSNAGEEVVAHIVPDYEFIDLKHGVHTNITPEQIERWIRKEVDTINNSLPQYKRIREATIREEEFPKTSTRKIKRYLFRKRDIQVGS